MSIGELRRALDESAQRLGMEHPNTLVARRNLARAYYDAGDYAQAFLLHEQIVDGVVRLVGDDQPITVSALGDLAHVWFRGWLSDDRPALAIPLFELALRERIRVTGANDSGALSMRSELATVYAAAGQLRRAIAVYEQILADCTRASAADHSLVEYVQGNLRAVAKVRDRVMAVPGRDQDDTAMAAQIAAALSEDLGLNPRVEGGWVFVEIPALAETLIVPAYNVKRVTRSFAPTGDPAVELVMIDGDDAGIRPLIILADNVAFAPEDPTAVLQSPVPVVVSDAPTLVTYQEMVRDAERFAMAAASPDAPQDSGVVGTTLRLGSLAGTCLLVRCIIAGAVRLGLRSLRPVAWWQRGWQASWAGQQLPPFPPDPVWAHLARISAGIALDLPPATAADRARDGSDAATLTATLTVADFEAVAPRLSVAQLDEEFLSLWRRWIPLTPARFADLLSDRLSGACAEVALYPGGGGSIDLVVGREGEVRAVVQLRFDVAAREMHLDEIRIVEKARGTGLFQRLQYNIEKLGSALALDALYLMATGMGSYAFAVNVFPRDRELYAKVHGSAKRHEGSS